MNKFINIKSILLAISSLLMLSCVDPYQLQTNTFEDAIVIEATITNELKTQVIKVSKTYRFEENQPTMVSGAQVFIEDDLGTIYNFQQSGEAYTSTSEFQAIPGRIYTLTVYTDGKTYQSKTETLTTVNPIDTVTATVENNQGITGVQIRANNFDQNFNSKYYRYEYEETHKVIAPNWAPFMAVAAYFPGPPSNGDPGYINVVPRTYEARICYTTKKSTTIIQDITNTLSEDRVRTPIRFINKDDYTIANRYSILVRQYIQNQYSYSYYRTLKELSGSESLLSQNQPGFFYGNLRCIENSNEKVIGYFEVASVSEKRIFFNYNDLFPEERLPDYPYDCEISNYSFCYGPSLVCQGTLLLTGFITKRIAVVSNSGIEYEICPIECGDCTSISSNIIPPFWYD